MIHPLHPGIRSRLHFISLYSDYIVPSKTYQGLVLLKAFKKSQMVPGLHPTQFFVQNRNPHDNLPNLRTEPKNNCRDSKTDRQTDRQREDRQTDKPLNGYIIHLKAFTKTIQTL